MALQLERRLFTVAEFNQMGRAGILSEDDRVELLDGEIITKALIGSRHAACVNRLNEWLSARSGGKFQVRVQNPILLDEYSEPEPDIALLRPKSDYYASQHPSPGDVVLLVEVSESSIDYDRGFKLTRYARAGICEVWIVDLDSSAILKCHTPQGETYSSMQRLEAGASIQPELLSNVRLDVAKILGQQ